MLTRMSTFVECLKPYEAVITEHGTDKNTTHSYGPVYDTLFYPYKEKPIRLLEIGIAGGYALLAYADYFPNADIYGIDIVNSVHKKAWENPRFGLTIANALEKPVVDSYKGIFDIIIEDASHKVEHQIQHFRDFAPKVASGGLYIIEDIVGPNADYIKNTIRPIADCLGFSLEIIDLRSVKGRYDDVLIVARRN